MATNDRDQVNHEEEQKPQGRPDQRPQKRREEAGTSIPWQKPSWEKRGGGGRVTMISRGVEISIAGCVGEMVRGLLSGLSFFSFFFFS